MSIKLLSEADALVRPLRESAEPEVLEQALAAAARVDGDRVVDQFEAEAVRSAWDATVPAGATATAATTAAFQSALATRIAALKAARAQTTEVLFTSEGAALRTFREKIVGSMQEVVAKAAGRPVDVNMMVFAFTDAVMADAIVAMARANPNVTFRLLTDWGQLAGSGDRQPMRLAQLARDEGLTNLVVKFKKDSPYVWSEASGQPEYAHGASTGLNHHKGFVALLDGVPQKMTLGSFNWSASGLRSNYENLMVLDRRDADNRPVMDGYQREFEAFWNRDDVALTVDEALLEKDRQCAALYAEHGVPYSPRVAGAGAVDPVYSAIVARKPYDVNSFADLDFAALVEVAGPALAGAIVDELCAYGRFDTWTELLARVPALAEADTFVRERLMAGLEYGEGGLSVNRASVSELERAGLTSAQAAALVAYREIRGAFESVAELEAVHGIGPKTVERLAETLGADEVIGTYSARAPGALATPGWAVHAGRFRVPATGRSEREGELRATLTPAHRESLEEVAPTLAAPVADLLRRAAPGAIFRLAMYGLSRRSEEFGELVRAAERGVAIRAVLYDEHNEDAVAAFEELRARGLDVEIRVISARVMHEKFGVVGDDCFNGSANWSGSSIAKNSEDRFYFRNQPALAHRFIEEFARLWEKGRAPG